MALNGFSGFGLGVFLVVVFFVVWPVSFLLPRKLKIPLEEVAYKLRLLDSSYKEKERWHVHLSLATAPVVGVLLLLATTSIDGSVIRLGLGGEGHARPYDVLVLFIALAYIAIALDQTGALRSMAFLVAQKGGTSGPWLFVLLFSFFFTFGAIFGNDPIVLSGTAFLSYFCRSTGIEWPFAFLFAEFVAANISSAILVTSNPTNVLVAGGFNLNFITGFTKYTILPSLITALIACPLLFFMFRSTRPNSIPSRLVLPEIDPRTALIDPSGALFHGCLMITTLAVLVGGSFVRGDRVQVWQVTLAGGGIGLLHDLFVDWKRGPTSPLVSVEELELDTPKSETRPLPNTLTKRMTLPYLLRRFCLRFPVTSSTIKKLPIPLLPFAASMFILVRSLGHLGWIEVFAGWMAAICTTPAKSVFFTGYMTALVLCPMCGTNIGATILAVQILQHPRFADSIHVQADPRILEGAIYAVAMGSNIGGFAFVFAASLAGLLWRNILRQKGILVSSKQFAVWNLIPVVFLSTVSFAIVYAQLFFL